MGEDVVTIPKGFNGSFVVNVATIFESENFFLPGIKWNGILGLAYAALAKVGIIQSVSIPRNGGRGVSENLSPDSPVRGSGGPGENRVVGTDQWPQIYFLVFLKLKVNGTIL